MYAAITQAEMKSRVNQWRINISWTFEILFYVHIEFITYNLSLNI